MATNWTTKQQSFVQRFSMQVVNLMAASDILNALCTEYTDDFYGTGGANALTDTVVQGVLPAATAANIASAEAALSGANQILAIITANRGYLEMCRP